MKQAICAFFLFLTSAVPVAAQQPALPLLGALSGGGGSGLGQNLALPAEAGPFGGLLSLSEAGGVIGALPLLPGGDGQTLPGLLETTLLDGGPITAGDLILLLPFEPLQAITLLGPVSDLAALSPIPPTDLLGLSPIGLADVFRIATTPRGP